MRYLPIGTVSALAGMVCFSASANIVLNTTRVVYPESEKEVTVKIDNNDKTAVLVQNWIDNGNVSASPETIKVPFILTPAVNRIDPGKGQTMRISYTGADLAKDRESLYYLNVLEIPPIKTSGATDNHVQVAFRTRIKMFFRPDGLKGEQNTSAEKIKWQANGNKLRAVNNSPYYITLLQVNIRHAGKSEKVIADMAAPFNAVDVPLKSGMSAAAGDSIEYQYLNDWGAVKTVKSTLQ
jgi:chaperone protein EcpD